jgi:hypothetical protein
MIEILINLLVICLILGLLWWAISAIPMPSPIAVFVRVAFALIAILLLLGCFDVIAPLHIYHYRRL